MSFADHGVAAPVYEALARRNIHEPFRIQALVLRDAIAGRDILAKSKTGSGKTIAFGIPVVQRLEPPMPRPSALVLVPTRELAVQVTDELRDIAAARNIRVASVYGGVSIGKQGERARKAHVLVATPGRLTDLVDRGVVTLGHISILVLDEADRMLDMGFQPQVDHIVRRLPSDRQTMFFSATLDGNAGQLARRYTTDAARHEVDDERPTVDETDHRFIAVDEHHKLDKLVDVLNEERQLALVFVRTKRGAERLKARLSSRGISCLALHGDMTQAARERALERFAGGKVTVMVATDVAARGLDLDHISHVINYDPPQGHKDYLHRVGRTARAGRSGTGITFVAPSQQQEVSAVARQLELKDDFEAAGLQVQRAAVVFSSRGRRSMMRPQRKRKF